MDQPTELSEIKVAEDKNQSSLVTISIAIIAEIMKQHVFWMAVGSTVLVPPTNQLMKL